MPVPLAWPAETGAYPARVDPLGGAIAVELVAACRSGLVKRFPFP